MKYCPNCGKSLEDRVMVCSTCNANLALTGTAAPPQMSSMAIASFLCALGGVISFSGIAAIVLGHMARTQIRRSGGRLMGAKLALAGLILGYASLLVTPILFASIAWPNLVRSRMASNEATTVGSLRLINTAARFYRDQYGQFPPDLASLGPPQQGNEVSAQRGDLIDSVLASAQRSGYSFRYELWDTDGDGVGDSYEIHAEPITRGTTGQRYFFTDQSGVIRMESDRPATAQSRPL